MKVMRLRYRKNKGTAVLELHMSDDNVVEKITVDGKDVEFPEEFLNEESQEPADARATLIGYTPLVAESSPCWFDGCEEMRAQFLKEKAMLAEKNGGTCPGCQLGGLIRKYVAKMKEAGVPPSPNVAL